MSSEICKEISVDHTKNDYSHIYSGQLNQREQISLSNTGYYYINTCRETINASTGLRIQNLHKRETKAKPNRCFGLSLSLQNSTFSLFLLPFPFSFLQKILLIFFFVFSVTIEMGPAIFFGVVSPSNSGNVSPWYAAGPTITKSCPSLP